MIPSFGPFAETHYSAQGLFFPVLLGVAVTAFSLAVEWLVGLHSDQRQFSRKNQPNTKGAS